MATFSAGGCTSPRKRTRLFGRRDLAATCPVWDLGLESCGNVTRVWAASPALSAHARQAPHPPTLSQRSLITTLSGFGHRAKQAQDETPKAGNLEQSPPASAVKSDQLRAAKACSSTNENPQQRSRRGLDKPTWFLFLESMV